MITRILSLLVVVLAVGCSQGRQAVKTVPKSSNLPVMVAKTPSPTALAKRKELRDWWFKAAEKAASSTGDSEANRLVAFLRLNAILAEPFGDQAKTLEASKSEEWFYFVPLIEGDELSGEFWAKLLASPNVGASFNPGTGLLIVRSDPISQDWAGIILLHEVRHVRDLITEEYNWQDNMTFCRKERDVHEFENRLIAKLGGERYQKFVDAEVQNMVGASRDAKLELGESMLTGTEYPQELDKIFGVAKSDFERAVRATHVDIDVNFRLVDRYWKGNKEEQKAVMLFKLYKSTGILPSPP